MGPVPAGAVARVAGAAAGSRASARRAPLARLRGVAGRARVGPGGEEIALKEPAELCQGCPGCLPFYSAGLQGFFCVRGTRLTLENEIPSLSGGE